MRWTPIVQIFLTRHCDLETRITVCVSMRLCVCVCLYVNPECLGGIQGDGAHLPGEGPAAGELALQGL